MLSRLQMLANMAKRITDLQDALELAEEAVRAKQHSSVVLDENNNQGASNDAT